MPVSWPFTLSKHYLGSCVEISPQVRCKDLHIVLVFVFSTRITLSAYPWMNHVFCSHKQHFLWCLPESLCCLYLEGIKKPGLQALSSTGNWKILAERIFFLLADWHRREKNKRFLSPCFSCRRFWGEKSHVSPCTRLRVAAWPGMTHAAQKRLPCRLVTRWQLLVF